MVTSLTTIIIGTHSEIPPQNGICNTIATIVTIPTQFHLSAETDENGSQVRRIDNGAYTANERAMVTSCQTACPNRLVENDSHYWFTIAQIEHMFGIVAPDTAIISSDS